MKTTYESFDELADTMNDGDGILHLFNCAQHEDENMSPCMAWQSGVSAFAQWLDNIGCKVEIDDSAESFYDFRARKAKKE